MKKQKVKYSIGFDLGGTKLAAALIHCDGTIIEFIKMPVHMNRDHSAQKTQARIVQMIVDIAVDFKQRYPKECSSSLFAGVGLVSAGPLNAETGELIYPANYPGWKVVPLKDRVQRQLHKAGFKTAVHFQNDAMAAALAEGWIGGAQKLKSFCVLTVGTGIGSGVILNNQPCQTEGMGSEFGHLFYRPQLLNKISTAPSSIEGVASGTALLSYARSLGFNGQSVEELVASKNVKYNVLFDEMSQALAVLCFNLSIGFRLQKIFVSGGLIKIQDKFLLKTQKAYQKMIREFNSSYECKIEVAKTKNMAGVLGAGFLPFMK